MHGSFAGMGDRAGRAVRKFRISSRKRIMAGLAKEIAEGKKHFLLQRTDQPRNVMISSRSLSHAGSLSRIR